MNTFIRASEVWVPSADRTMLEFGGGLYGKATRFGALSRTLCFGRGEGLPGQAWEQGRPLVLRTFDNSYFRRTAAAHAEGITCGIAVPIYAGDFLTSVLVIFCGDDAAHAGAIELWRNDPASVGRHDARRRLLRHHRRHLRVHLAPAPAFAAAAACRAWPGSRDCRCSSRTSGKGARFLRADAALKVGINRGFAMPCPIRGDENYVLAFLSALNTPIARRFEIWKPDPARARLRLDGGFCEAGGLLTAAPEHLGLDRGQGTIGRVFLTGVPAVSDNAASEPAGWGAAAAELGLETMLAVPVIQEGRLVAAVAWYF